MSHRVSKSKGQKVSPDREQQMGRATRRRGQSTVEMALVLPLLIVLFSVIVEASLAFNSWMRVNTAARDSTRFLLDAGRVSDVTDIVRNKLTGLADSTLR